MALGTILKTLRLRLGTEDWFMKSVRTLIGGTMAAQVVAALALPILTRVYTPADFSLLAVYASLLTILGVAACLRFEIAIPGPERDEDAANLLVLALAASFGIATVIALPAFVAPKWIAQCIGSPALEPYLWMVPLGVWVSSSCTALQFWATRTKRFGQISTARVAQAAGGAGTQVGMGLAGAGPFGLVLGHLVSAGGGLFVLARDVWNGARSGLRAVTWRSLGRTFRTYSRYPKYATLDALTNTMGALLPVVVIAALAVGPEAGYLILAMKLMAMPIALFGGAVAQVFLSQAPAALRDGRLTPLAIQVMIRLSKIGVGPLILAGIAAAPLFEVVFGTGWRRAGELVSWMTPWFVLQLLSSPVSMVMHVADRQRTMLFINAGGLVVRLGSVLIAYLLAPDLLSEAYAASGALLYLLCCVVFYRVAGVGLDSWLSAIRSSVLSIAMWAAAGIIIRAVITVAT